MCGRSAICTLCEKGESAKGGQVAVGRALDRTRMSGKLTGAVVVVVRSCRVREASGCPLLK